MCATKITVSKAVSLRSYFTLNRVCGLPVLTDYVQTIELRHIPIQDHYSSEFLQGVLGAVVIYHCTCHSFGLFFSALLLGFSQ